MENRRDFEGEVARSGPSLGLARWLQKVMAPPGSHDVLSEADSSEQLALLHTAQDHLRFYRQLPDLAFSFLQNNPDTYQRYASLLYHLIGCSLCRSAYREIYDALGAALSADSSSSENPAAPHSLAAVPARALIHLCQALIRQAELLLRQTTPPEATLYDEARHLLQQAIRVSASIMQMRERALQDLVRVATLFASLQEEESPQEPPLYTYALRQGTGARPGSRAVRRAASGGAPAAPPVLLLQAGLYEGSVTQQGELLELHLQGLKPELRGSYVEIALPLGLIFEPVAWIGGNPRAIRSAAPVDDQGRLTTPLGRTTLQLSNPEDRNLLEVMFLRLEVRSSPPPA